MYGRLTNEESRQSMVDRVVTRGELLRYEPKYPFGRKSKRIRSELSNNLIHVTNVVADKWDISLIEGIRSQARQDILYANRDSRIRVSKHTPIPPSPYSVAVDMAPYPIDWNDEVQFIRFGYYVQGVAQGLGIDLRWGGDWDSDMDIEDQTFNDRVHFEERVT